jgi:hypothetical protein
VSDNLDCSTLNACRLMSSLMWDGTPVITGCNFDGSQKREIFLAI